MNKNILEKLENLANEAKKHGSKKTNDVKVVSSINGTALTRVIKTEEDADLFMRRLNALR